MQSLAREIRFSFRALLREPGSALVAVVTLALGIGLCTNTFSLFYGVMIRGLGIPEADRVRVIQRSNPSRNQDFMAANQHDYYDWRERQHSFEGMGSYTGGGTVSLRDSLGPERYEGTRVSSTLFDVLRVRPILGTGFSPDDEKAGAPLTVMLSHWLWSTRYRGDSSIVGRSVYIDGTAATVLGVMPPGFLFPQESLLWTAQRDLRGNTPTREGGPQVKVAARLKDGITWDQADADMKSIAAALAREYPATNEGVTTVFQTFVEDDNGTEVITVFTAMLVATVLVLLIACANVANLVLARALLRVREAAVRTAVGASRFEVVLPFFVETGLLAFAGAVIGTAIAYGGITLFDRATQDVGKPYYMIFDLNPVVLAFVAALTVLTTLAAGAAPAFHVLRANLGATLKDESRGASSMSGGRISRALVVTQVAFSCALLVGAGLMVKSLTKIETYDFPFETGQVLTARVALIDARYPDSVARRRFWQTLEERLTTMPGAGGVALTTELPGGSGDGRVAVEGEAYATDRDFPTAGSTAITPRFFDTFGVRLLNGRGFNASDDERGARVAIVDEEFSRLYFRGADPIGRRIRPGGSIKSPSTWPWLTIVGVAPTLAVRGLEPGQGNLARYYYPLAQLDRGSAAIAIRTEGDPIRLAPTLRELVRALDPDLPVFDVRSMESAMREETWFFRVFGTVFIVFGAAALFMASVGLYGVLAFSVSRRLREMGVRMALGASAGDVIRLVVRQGAWQAGFGLVIGLGMALALSRLIGLLMFGVSPRDPLVFGGVALVIAAVALAASWVPARRATAVDPIVALRYD